MMNCWQNEPKARPSFTALTKQLKEMENQHKVRLLLPYALTRDDAETYDVSFFFFLCSLLFFLIWFGFPSIERKLVFELGSGRPFL